MPLPHGHPGCGLVGAACQQALCVGRSSARAGCSRGRCRQTAPGWQCHLLMLHAAEPTRGAQDSGVAARWGPAGGSSGPSLSLALHPAATVSSPKCLSHGPGECRGVWGRGLLAPGRGGPQSSPCETEGLSVSLMRVTRHSFLWEQACHSLQSIKLCSKSCWSESV